MSFYDLPKEQRVKLVANIKNQLLAGLATLQLDKIIFFFGDPDTYVRKAAYLSTGDIYRGNKNLRNKIIKALDVLLLHDDFKIRQTAVNAAGEIGKSYFTVVAHIFSKGLFDKHHSPRNAVIGSIKKMGERNPSQVLPWAKKYLHHADKEIRREICHGIELRGRKYPQDILPLLRELEYDKAARVKTTLVHVLGQISYKKGCLQTVVQHLKTWSNKALVAEALEEIIDVHERYKKFSAITALQAREYIEKHS